MFQAIKHSTILIPFIFFLSAATVFSAPLTEEEKPCSKGERGIPLSYYLSRAYQAQRSGFHKTEERKTEEAKKQHRQAIEYFNLYHSCLEERGQGPSHLSARSLASSHLELDNFAEAESWADKAITIQKAKEIPSRELLLLKSRILLKQGKLEPAGLLLRTYLAEYPNDPDFLYYLGNIYFDLKSWNRSYLYFLSLRNVLLDRDRGSRILPIVAKYLGELNYKLDHSEKSTQYYEEYLESSPNDTEIRYKLAQIYFTLEDFFKAKKHLAYIRQINPREIDASHMLGEMYFLYSRVFAPNFFAVLEAEKKIPRDGVVLFLHRYLRGDTEGLLPLVAKYVEKNPNRLSTQILFADLIPTSYAEERYKAYVNVASMSYQYRQYELAKKYFAKALSLSGEVDSLKKESGNLWERISQCEEMQKNYYSALLDLREALRFIQDPTMEDLMNHKLVYLLLNPKINRIEDAEVVINKLIQKDANKAEYFYTRAAIESQKELHANALKSFTKANELKKNDPNFIFFLAVAHDRVKDQKKSDAILEQLIQSHPEYPNSYNYLGYSYAEREIEKEKAEKYLVKANDLEPDNAAFLDSLGWIYFKQNRRKEAMLYLHFAELVSEEKKQEDFVIFDHLGDVYRSDKDLVKAQYYYKKAEENAKTDSLQKKIQTKWKQVSKELSK
ncbi:tetratricopeptide repeat protein [Leptospira ryugenii]|uniref:Tetratricopeptide repeat protein n=1 Tax=Leptospira ryugenii TaxID=1917863 RepID=A0A2P2DVZ1_9LEPT|nr:tetratricopeptide repeat protein [Leptospira ryugenii]GBF48730.1 tetratricopeptide repeat protein [Leptospira ryugenii]